MLYLTIIGGAFIAWLILAVLFTPHVPYHIEAGHRRAQRSLHPRPRVDLLRRTSSTATASTSSPTATRSTRRCWTRSAAARETINMECYIFKKGEIGDAFIDALCERARAGVRVTHRDGCHRQLRRLRQSSRPLEAAGCRVAAYQRFTWYRLEPPEQPDAPRAAGRRRHRGVRRRRRRRGLVGEAAPRQADVARHDGAHRRAGRVATSRASSPRTGWNAAAKS